MSETNEKKGRRAHLIHTRFKFPPGAKDHEGAPLASLVVRELDSYDLLTAAKLGDANGTDGTQERVAQAIVLVNDAPLVTGSIDGWNQIAVEFAMMAYLRVSSVRTSLAEEYLGKGEVVPAV